MHDEGVIKFQLEHVSVADAGIPVATVAAFEGWRQIFNTLGIMGQSPARYGGAAFGNLSFKLDGPGFAITGTQTAGLERMGPQHWAVVDHFDARRNVVRSRGVLRPSSESLTHGTLYALRPQLRAIVHVHSPVLWRAASALGIPETAADVAYGTPEMAREMGRLFADTDVGRQRIFSMAGHEDGVVSFGCDVDDAAHLMLRALARASTA